MEQQVPDTVSRVFDEMARRFGATGAELWTQYVHYVWTYAFVWMVCGSLAFLVVGTIAQTAIRPEDKCDQEAARIARALIWAGCIVIAGLFVACNLADVLMPQGAAIAHIAGR